MEQAMLVNAPIRRAKHLKVPRFARSDTDFYTYRLPDAARLAFRRPVQLTGSQWAERYRVMDDEAPRPGPWSNDYARFLCGPMDALAFPFVREITIVAPPQTGKTEIMMNYLASVIDQAPGPALMVFDQQAMAERMAKTRVKDMINLSPRLRRYKTGRADDFSRFEIALQHMRIGFGWATSVSQLSNISIRYLYLDEVDKYENANKAEAGPVELATKRTRFYKHTSKTIFASTPTIKTGPVTVAHARMQAKFEYAVRCPDCLQYHVMQFSGPNGTGVVWPKEERNPETIQAKRLARYLCPVCGEAAGWDDYKRDLAVKNGYWREKETHVELLAYCKQYRPRSCGFQYSALVSAVVSLSETAAKFVYASAQLKHGFVEGYKDWLNGYMGEVWEDDYSPRKESAILALRDERPAGILPDTSQVAALLAAVDTQDNGFYYEIRAFGYGAETESWQVRAGFVESFDALDRVLWIPYPDINGISHTVKLAGIDMQGHRTRDVIQWCLDNRGRAIPLVGERTMKEPYKLFPQEYWPGTKMRVDGGLYRLHVDTKYYKDALHNKLAIAGVDPGAWHMNAEATEAWARQMCAEYVDEKGVWVCPKGKDNHAFDVSVYVFCLADFFGTRYMVPEEAETSFETPLTPKKEARLQGGRKRMW